MFEELAARFGPPDEESVFECTACGTEIEETRIDCPDCGDVVVRVVLDPDIRVVPDVVDTPDLAR